MRIETTIGLRLRSDQCQQRGDVDGERCGGKTASMLVRTARVYFWRAG